MYMTYSWGIKNLQRRLQTTLHFMKVNINMNIIGQKLKSSWQHERILTQYWKGDQSHLRKTWKYNKNFTVTFCGHYDTINHFDKTNFMP